MNLGVNDFQMLMMVLNDNLLEGQNGKCHFRLMCNCIFTAAVGKSF